MNDVITDHMRQSAGDNDVSGSVELLTLGVHHEEREIVPRPRYPRHHLLVVLEADADPVHLHHLVPDLDPAVVGGRVGLHAGDVTLT